MNSIKIPAIEGGGGVFVLKIGRSFWGGNTLYQLQI